jgi:hypothetical protein
LSWEIIDNHRLKARQIRFHILIWGPSYENTLLFNIRREIRDYFNNNGHSAKFSEELIQEGTAKAAPETITDEIFHADAADIIIVLYESRGTQTEFDRILKYERFIKKTIIFIEISTWENIMNSLSKNEWLKINNKVIKMKLFDINEILQDINSYIETLQFSEYLRKLELEFLS